MTYEIAFKPQATRDLDALSTEVRQRMSRKIDAMRDDLAGDVKRLKAFIPRYRLRVGDYRVLFDLDGALVIVYRIVHRSGAYN